MTKREELMLTTFRIMAFGAALFLAAIENANANLIFDNFDAPGSFSIRGAQNSPGASLEVAQTTAISNVAVFNQLDGDGELKFLIFDSDTETLLFESAPKSFSADLQPTWKMSDNFSFTLLAGRRYDIGAIANVSGDWAFDLTANSQNGISSLLQNSNFSNFAFPQLVGRGAADGAVRLFQVPEPSSLALMGLLVCGVATRCRD